jgi:cyclic nucleotide-binding protein
VASCEMERNATLLIVPLSVVATSRPAPVLRRRQFVAERPFHLTEFLNVTGNGRTSKKYRKNQKVYSQGDSADAVFYVQEGKLKVCVISEHGKEAVVALHGGGDFFGEGCLTGQPLRLATVFAMTDCVVTRIDKASMVATLHGEPKLCETSSRTSWLAAPGSKKTWSTSFSIQANNLWREFFC